MNAQEKLLQFLHDGRCAHVRTSTPDNLEAVEVFIQANPWSVKEKNPASGRFVLHDAVSSEHYQNVTLRKLDYLLRANPTAASTKDRAGQLPLHIASTIFSSHHQNQQLLEVLQMLLFSFDCASSIRDSSGYLPLHLAIIAQNPVTVRFLIENHFGSLHDCDKHPLLHTLLKEYPHCDPSLVKLLIEKVPSCLKVENKDGSLPLVTALRCNCDPVASWKKILLILQAHGKAAATQNRHGNFPLHVEVMRHCRLPVLQLLYQIHKPAMRHVNLYGNNPMHIAAYNGCVNPACLEFMYDAYPASLMVQDEPHGETPLHFLFRSNTPFCTAKARWLIRKNALAARVTNKQDDLPLHMAAYHSYCFVDVLTLLVEAFPPALAAPDADGDLPLHLAVYTATATGLRENIDYLLNVYPEASKRANAEGKLPIHLACSHMVSLDIIKLLFDHNPASLLQFDNEGYLPLHGACCSPTHDAQAAVTTVEYLIGQHEEERVPATRNRVHPLLLASEKNASLDVIMLLVHRSLDLFVSRSPMCSIRKRPRARGDGILELASDRPRHRAKVVSPSAPGHRFEEVS